MDVVPENAILVETHVSSGELACVRAANKGKRSMNVRALALKSPDLKGGRVFLGSDGQHKQTASRTQAARR